MMCVICEAFTKIPNCNDTTAALVDWLLFGALGSSSGIIVVS